MIVSGFTKATILVSAALFTLAFFSGLWRTNLWWFLIAGFGTAFMLLLDCIGFRSGDYADQ